MRIAALLLVSFAAIALSGCLGNEVTISGQGGAFGTKEKTLNCGGSGTVLVGEQGGGTFVVRVYDADGNLIYKSGGFSGGQSASGGSATGVPGTWTLEVDFGTGYGGQYSVSLKC